MFRGTATPLARFKYAIRPLPTSKIWAPVPAISNFCRTLHAKNGEWMLLLPFFALGIIVVFKTDSILPGYTAVIMGDGKDMNSPSAIPIGNRAPDPLDSYHLEPIRDDATGKIIAMRKIKKKPAAAAVASDSQQANGEDQHHHAQEAQQQR